MLGESGDDRIEITCGRAQVLRELDVTAGGLTRRASRRLGSVGRLFVQVGTTRGNAILLPVGDGEAVEAAEARARRRAESADDEAEIAAWIATAGGDRDGETAERMMAGGVVSRAGVHRGDGTLAGTVRLVDHDVACHERYAWTWAVLGEVFAASVRTGSPVVWGAVEDGA